VKGKVASDSTRSTPNFEQRRPSRGPGGVDTVRLRGAVHPSALTALPEQDLRVEVDSNGVVTSQVMGSSVVLPGGTVVHVDQRRRRHAEAEAWFEVSIPSIIHGHNLWPATAQQLSVEVARLYDDAGMHVEWRCALLRLAVMRLDLPYDFTCARDTALLLRRLLDVPVPRTKPATSYMRANEVGVQTLYRETDRWQVRAYDKMQEMSAKGFVGCADPVHYGSILRVEVQLRREACNRSGIYFLEDVTHADLPSIHEHYFERTYMGITVGGGSRKVREAAQTVRGRKGGPAQLDALLGVLARQAHGLPSGRSRNTEDKYRAMAKELRLLPSDVVEPHLEAMRLDYDSGRLVFGDEALR
jgi:hypothetical protein